MNNEIIFFHSKLLSTPVEVRIEDDAVWLNRNQISLLFARDVKTIGKHISNAANEELKDISVVANLRQLQLMVKFIKWSIIILI